MDNLHRVAVTAMEAFRAELERWDELGICEAGPCPWPEETVRRRDALMVSARVLRVALARCPTLNVDVLDRMLWAVSEGAGADGGLMPSGAAVGELRHALDVLAESLPKVAGASSSAVDEAAKVKEAAARDFVADRPLYSCWEKAHASHERALRADPSLKGKTLKRIWQHLKDNEDPEEYVVPTYANWCRYRCNWALAMRERERKLLAK